MTTFTIPVDPTKADDLATELGELATATEWKRAAIVYARVQVGQHGGDRTKTRTDLDSGKLTTEQYALLGIHGLRSKTTIRAYWRAWDNAINEGVAEPVSLGDEVGLPDAEWADYYHPTMAQLVPPYYRPGPVLDRLIPTDSPVDDEELGECPPRASGESEFPEEASEYTVIRLPGARSDGREYTTVRDEAEPYDDDGPAVLHARDLNRWMTSVFEPVATLLEIISEYDEFEDTKYALEYAEKIHAVLNSIRLILRRNSDIVVVPGDI
jgi:hypothetical protein